MSHTSADDRAHNHELLSDLFEAVYQTLKDGRGSRWTLARERYMHPDLVREVVEQAIRKFELEAYDALRKVAEFDPNIALDEED